MIVVTGASGQLGHHAVKQLLAQGQPVVAAARTLDKAQSLAAAGAQLRHANYDEPATLDAALKGASALLLISSSEVGKRFTQHQAIIDAAKRAAVPRVVYTSLLQADTAGTILAAEHAQTEAYLKSSGLKFTILRNGWYLENYTEQLPKTLELGALYAAAGEGKVSVATRADYAAAATAVLTSPGHDGQVYELGGESLTLSQLAEKFSAWAGKSIPYVSLEQAAFKAALVQAGLPEPFAEVLADADAGLSRGTLHVTTGDLERLIGRPPTTVDQALAELPKP